MSKKRPDLNFRLLCKEIKSGVDLAKVMIRFATTDKARRDQRKFIATLQRAKEFILRHPYKSKALAHFSKGSSDEVVRVAHRQAFNLIESGDYDD